MTASPPPAAAAPAKADGAGTPTVTAAAPPGTAPADTAPDPEAAARIAREDAVLASGADVAGLRALLACAYTRPSPEPARPFSHWDAVLAEAHWLAVDFAQERLWKASTALAVAAEVAGKRGEFGLRPPPPEHRAFHDEIVAARAAAVAAAAAVAGKRLTAAARAEAGAGLALDPTADPIWADLALEAIPPTPPGFDYALVYSVEPELAPALEATLESRELERAIEADMVCASLWVGEGGVWWGCWRCS